MDYTAEMAKRMRLARIDAGLMQDDVARHLGVSRWTYSRAENGWRPITDKWIDRLPPEMRRPLYELQKTLLLAQAKEMDKKIGPASGREPRTRGPRTPRQFMEQWAKQPAPAKPRIKRPTIDTSRLTRPTA